MSIYLDVDIGDFEQDQLQTASFRASEAFFQQVGPQFGLIGSLEDQDSESKFLLQEAFASNPSAKGEFLTVKPADLTAGRLVIKLFEKEVPKTCENFRCLVTGERGRGKSSGKALHYKGCCFHRIVRGFMVQGGDIVKGDGSGGDSIYGGKFNDEKAGLKLKHDKLGVVGMANSGKNSNTSQFYITLEERLPRLDGKHVVFGQVIEGLEVLKRIAAEASSETGAPQLRTVIADCGMI